jgi:hypothetical protein
MPRILVGRSSAVTSAKLSRKPGPISVPNAAGPSVTAAPAKLTPAMRSWPWARRHPRHTAPSCSTPRPGWHAVPGNA